MAIWITCEAGGDKTALSIQQHISAESLPAEYFFWTFCVLFSCTFFTLFCYIFFTLFLDFLSRFFLHFFSRLLKIAHLVLPKAGHLVTSGNAVFPGY